MQNHSVVSDLKHADRISPIEFDLPSENKDLLLEKIF